MAGIQPVQLIAHTAENAKVATANVEAQTTGGNMLVAAWRSGSGNTLTAVTDTQDPDGTAWTVVQQSGGNNATAAIAIRPLVGDLGPTDTVSFTSSGTAANDFTVWEYSGIDLDAPFQTGVGTSGSSKTAISDTITPLTVTDGLFAAIGTGSATATATDTDGIFTARGVDTDGINLFDVLQADTTDPVTGSWSLSPSTNVGLCIVALKAAVYNGVSFRASTSVANGTASSVAFSVPSACQTDDVAYAIIETNAAATTVTTPADWTTLQEGDEYPWIGVYRKVLTADDLNTTASFGLDASYTCQGTLTVFSGSDTTNPEDQTSFSFALGNQTPGIDCPAVTTTDDGDMVLVFAVTGDDVTFEGPSGWIEGPSASKIVSYYSKQATAGDTGSQTITQSGTAYWGCGTIAIRAPQGGGTTTYNDSPTGALVLGGSVVQTKRASDSPTGLLTIHGVTVEQHVGADTPSGTLSLRGSIASSHRAINAPVGSLVLTGRLLANGTTPTPLMPTLLLLAANTFGLQLDAHTVGMALDDHDIGLSLND